MKTTTTMFAAIDEGSITGAVYGIGRTPDEALADARQWSGSDEGVYSVVPCSESAYAIIQRMGGEPNRAIAVSSMGVMTRAEAEQ